MTSTDAVCEEAVVQAMRDDGLAPPKLPEWKPVAPAPPPARRSDECKITDYTTVHVDYGKRGNGYLQSFLEGWTNVSWPTNGTEADQRLATLQFVAAEIEQALPIVRAMIEEKK